MKYFLMSILVITLAISLTGCGKESAAEQTEAQKKATAEFEKQLAESKKQAEKLLASAKEKANADTEAAIEKVQHAIDSAEKLAGQLKASGGKAWDEKKPVADAAIKDLSTKVSDELTKLKLGDFRLPLAGMERPPAKEPVTVTTTQKATTQKATTQRGK